MGVRAAIILAVGFAESGEEGAELQASLLEAARDSGVRIVGPNTSGLLNLGLGLNLVGTPDLTPGSIGILSQSGNIALALMNEGGRTPGVGVSVYVGVGNEADIGCHEYLDVLAEDDGTDVIVIYADGMRAPGAFPRHTFQAHRVSQGREAARGLDGGAVAHRSIGGSLRCVERRSQAGRRGGGDA